LLSMSFVTWATLPDLFHFSCFSGRVSHFCPTYSLPCS
jgi:hypothetical protein